MADRIFGLETEYAFTARTNRGPVADIRPEMDRIEQLAAALLPNLPSFHRSGIFLQNGSRFYRDPGGGGAHLELATPECENPWDAVRYLQAGERILANLAAEHQRRHSRIVEAAFYKTNVDYSGTGSSWGCHESYLTRQPLRSVTPQIVPHLVSRIIYTGAGGLGPFHDGIEFTLSPRVAHISAIENGASEHDRPIVHTRDEPLANNGCRRLHIICGESLCSETAAWLKSATTALVVALIDAEVDCGAAVRLKHPVNAMHTFAGDPECRVTAELADGRPVTALAIQRQYLQLAERHLGAAFMPPWAEEACRQWRRILDRLEQGSHAGGRTLDWAIKLALFRDRAERRGFAWSSIPLWNGVVRALRAVHERQTEDRPRFTLALLGDLASPLRAEWARLSPGLQAVNLNPDLLPTFLHLRNELAEIDWRYSRLGEGSLFASLDRAGCLDHHFPGVNNIEHAMANPPNFGRALVRGRNIRQLASRRADYWCGWTGIFDVKNRRKLDLADPFCAEERWSELSDLDCAPPTVPDRLRILFHASLAGEG